MDQPEQTALVNRITEYLSLGGLWNPESVEHNKVRDLLIDCRDFLAAPAVSPDVPRCPKCKSAVIGPWNDDYRICLSCRERIFIGVAPVAASLDVPHEYEGIEIGLDKCIRCGKSREDHKVTDLSSTSMKSVRQRGDSVAAGGEGEFVPPANNASPQDARDLRDIAKAIEVGWDSSNWRRPQIPAELRIIADRLEKAAAPVAASPSAVAQSLEQSLKEWQTWIKGVMMTTDATHVSICHAMRDFGTTVLERRIARERAAASPDVLAAAEIAGFDAGWAEAIRETMTLEERKRIQANGRGELQKLLQKERADVLAGIDGLREEWRDTEWLDKFTGPERSAIRMCEQKLKMLRNELAKGKQP